MARGPAERAFRHDRSAIILAIVAVTALAWAYLLWHAARMDMPHAIDMHGGGMDMAGALAPGLASWSAGDFVFMFLMWAVMMVGMMMPSATPMVLIYAGVARQAAATGRRFAATGWFAGGYVLAWTGFALAATLLQWAMENAALLSPMGQATGTSLAGLLLIAAGLYQWTPLKDVCLSHCQAPLAFIQRHGGFRPEPLGSLGLGLRHGLYCVGCCWALMLVLFALGIMNLLWIAALAILVMAEKVVPAGNLVSRIAGAALIAAGTWMAATA